MKSVKSFAKTVSVSTLAEAAVVGLFNAELISLDSFMVLSALPLVGLLVAGLRAIGGEDSSADEN